MPKGQRGFQKGNQLAVGHGRPVGPTLKTKMEMIADRQSRRELAREWDRKTSAEIADLVESGGIDALRNEVARYVRLLYDANTTGDPKARLLVDQYVQGCKYGSGAIAAMHEEETVQATIVEDEDTQEEREIQHVTVIEIPANGREFKPEVKEIKKKAAKKKSKKKSR